MSLKDPLKDTVKDLSAPTEEKRDRILAVAKARFLHYGVSKTTMRDIAEELGISVSNLYLYFENKREIVLAIAQGCRAEQDEVVEGVLSDDALTPAQKLERLLVEKFRHVQAFRNDSPNGPELMAYLVQEFPERIVEWQAHFESAIRAVLEEGQRKGVFCLTDARHEALMLRLAIGQFFLPPHITLPVEPTEKELVQLLDWLLAKISIFPKALNQSKESERS